MDNVTHALAGMLVAETVLQHRGGRDAVPRRWPVGAYVASTIANNLPDLDIAYVGITSGKIGYLAHHRGHTHTLVFGLLVAAIALAGLGLVRRRGVGTWSKSDHRWMVGLVAFGPFLHLLMDFGNNYGIHPFWPLSNRWYYGDALFIVEPLLWASVAPALASAVASRSAKVLFALIAALGVALSWTTGHVPPPVAAIVTGWTAGVGALAWRKPKPHLVALGAVGLVYLAFVATGARARQVARSALRRLEDERIVEVALAPMPANPLCWRMNTLSVSGGQIVARRGRVLPLSVGASVCPEAAGTPTAPMSPMAGSPEAGPARLSHQMRWPVSELRALWRHCHARAYLRWSRLPYSARVDGRTVVGDLRYDSSPEVGWAEIVLPEDGACPEAVPEWTPPRHELIGAGE